MLDLKITFSECQAQHCLAQRSYLHLVLDRKNVGLPRSFTQQEWKSLISDFAAERSKNACDLSHPNSPQYIKHRVYLPPTKCTDFEPRSWMLRVEICRSHKLDETIRCKLEAIDMVYMSWMVKIGASHRRQNLDKESKFWVLTPRSWKQGQLS